jgi:ATP phosphoribosyltransferase regulatory subunit
MTIITNNRLRYPTGVRPLLAAETARRRSLETRIVDALESAGFAEVVLPIIDYVEPYAALTTRDAARQSYRFTDREGELVAIRADFTPMLARALAPELRADELPLRLFYRGDVIRNEASRLGTNREMFQIGAEIVGDGSVDADVAMLRLAADLVPGAKVVYSDVAIAAAFPEMRNALATKRAGDGAPDVVAKLIAGTATIDDVAPVAPAAAERLRAIDKVLDDRFELHLDDADPAGYYTGLRFSVFSERTRVAQGGRYDDLYARFGASAPAIGFTFTVDDIGTRPSPAAGDRGVPPRRDD